ncbi:MAG TPA: hypothetical protein VHV83_00885 [Armatimonadota bacterium]|nr:hypothetical protein [Armatimonadota bacterium]
MKRQVKIALLLALCVVVVATVLLVSKGAFSSSHHSATAASSNVATDQFDKETDQSEKIAQDLVNKIPSSQQSTDEDNAQTGQNDRTSTRPPSATPAPRSMSKNGQPQLQRGTMRAKFVLVRLFRSIGRLDEASAPLTPAQAKAILAIMNPLRTQPTLTSEQAEKVTAELNTQLTPAQQQEIEQMHNRRPGQAGQGNGQQNGQPPANGGWRRGDQAGDQRGGPGGPNGPGQMSAADMEKMNPFNPGDSDPQFARMAERWQSIFASLEAKAQQ